MELLPLVFIALPDHMVDDDWFWRHQQSMQALWDFGKLHSLSFKNLKRGKKKLQLFQSIHKFQIPTVVWLNQALTKQQTRSKIFVYIKNIL